MQRTMVLFAILLVSCSTHTSEISQEISFCPYPPIRCQPTSTTADGACNQACIDQGGEAAYCPDVTPPEASNCYDFCSPLYTGEVWWECMLACGDRVWHQCVGGWEP